MKPAKIHATCPECQHEFEAKGDCIRHLPSKKPTTGNLHQIKRSTPDIKWSRLVRERDRVCQRCGRSHGQLDAAHIIRRRYKRLRPGFDKHTGNGCCLRHDILNGIALCVTCHRWFDEEARPEEKHLWLTMLIGADRLERLQIGKMWG